MKRIAANLVLLLALSFAIVWTPASLAQEVNLQDVHVYNEVYERLSPSVVAINVIARSSAATTNIPELDQPVFGTGSGFVIDQSGHIVTNNHVVEGATRIEVNFFDGTLVQAEIVGLDPDSDLAVLKVDLPADRLFPVEFANSDELEIGQPVLAIGSPFGQRWTLTSGIISALERAIPGMSNFSIGGVIQTDAPINPGNSGGPLLDLNGRVIGVNSQIRSASGSSSGIGFAIPSNLTQKVSQELIEQGFVDYSFVGINGGDVSLALIETLDLPNNTQGVVVGSVEAGGPADRAGLRDPDNFIEVDGLEVPQQVDIITAIDGEALSGMSELIGYLAANTEPGQTAVLSVLRNGTETLDLNVQLMPRR
jgi:2-alkenal reductase